MIKELTNREKEKLKKKLGCIVRLEIVSITFISHESHYMHSIFEEEIVMIVMQKTIFQNAFF